MGFAGFGDLGFDFDADFDAFDFEGTEGDALETSVYRRPVPRRTVAVAYEHAQDLARELEIDGETETFAFVSGNFVYGDLVEALVEDRAISVRRMCVQTLSMSEENIDSLYNVCMLCPVEELDLIVSDYWYAHERHKGGLVPYLFDRLDLDRLELRVAFAGTHCKVTTVETLAGNVLTMHGSANLRSSGNVEQVCISPDRGLYDFCEETARRILDAYDVVNQGNRRRRESIRRAALWQAVTEGGATPGRPTDTGRPHGTGTTDTRPWPRSTRQTRGTSGASRTTRATRGTTATRGGVTGGDDG